MAFIGPVIWETAPVLGEIGIETAEALGTAFTEGLGSLVEKESNKMLTGELSPEQKHFVRLMNTNPSASQGPDLERDARGLWDNIKSTWDTMVGDQPKFSTEVDHHTQQQNPKKHTWDELEGWDQPHRPYKDDSHADKKTKTSDNDWTTAFVHDRDHDQNYNQHDMGESTTSAAADDAAFAAIAEEDVYMHDVMRPIINGRKRLSVVPAQRINHQVNAWKNMVKNTNATLSKNSSITESNGTMQGYPKFRHNFSPGKMRIIDLFSFADPLDVRSIKNLF